jgi:FtsJ-like methyltransferase
LVRRCFGEVHVVKPDASRADSREYFLLARKFRPEGAAAFLKEWTADEPMFYSNPEYWDQP